MFVGTTPQEIRLLLQDILKGRKGEEVFVGCSGNFSTDKILSGMGFKVHANDVSLYSKLIADVVLGTDTEVKVNNKDIASVFAQWSETKYKKLVQVMFAIRLSELAPRKNDYQRQFYDSYITNSGEYYERTLEKFEKNQQFGFQIESFFFGDFVEHLKNKAGRGVGVAFPPTYKGGYEKMFKYIEDSFAYDRATYGVFDPKQSEVVFRELLQQDENIIYSDKEHMGLKEYEVAKAVLGSGRNSVYIYSSVKNSDCYYIERTSKPYTTKLEVIPYDYRITEQTKLEVAQCTVRDVNYFKAFYMANKVNYTEGGDYALAFLADGKAFGFASFSKRLSSEELMFVQSDFVVNSCMDKLSKLLIMLMKSKECRHTMVRFFKHYYKGLKTTVYTDKPVSMKYRGVFNLARRDKGKLIYEAGFGNETLEEIFKQWKKKYL
jgi:hypothetical protein